MIKGTAASLAAAGMFGTTGWLRQGEALAEAPEVEESVHYCWHKTHCQGCCSLKCTVRDGRLAMVQPNDIMENGRYAKVCLKGITEIQHVYSDERIQTPLRRVGGRGSNQFEAITWEEAFEDIYQNLSAVQERYGKDSVWAHVASECSEMNYIANILGCIKTTGTDGSDIGYGSGIDPATEFLGSTYAWATNGSRDWKNSEMLLVVGTNFLETSLTLFDSRTNYEIMRGLADKFGLGEYIPSSCEELARYELANSSNPDIAQMTLEDLVEAGGLLEIPGTDTPKQRTVEEILQTPTGRCDVYYENMLEVSQQLPNWDDPLEAYESNPLREKYPLFFNENTTRYFIHDAFHTATWLWQFSHASVEMNPVDMEERGLQDGDHIRAFNDRGEFGCVVRANDSVRPGVVRAWQAELGKYMDFGTFADVLQDKTHDRGRILRSGPSVLHSDALIQIEKA